MKGAPRAGGVMPKKENKCLALKGSERGHLYPWPDVLPTQGTPPALLIEGEPDALVGWQEAGPLAFVGTVGGGGQSPQPSAPAALARCPWWLLAFDHAAAGVKGPLAWHERAPHKARRVLLPHGIYHLRRRPGGLEDRVLDRGRHPEQHEQPERYGRLDIDSIRPVQPARGR